MEHALVAGAFALAGVIVGGLLNGWVERRTERARRVAEAKIAARLLIPELESLQLGLRRVAERGTVEELVPGRVRSKLWPEHRAVFARVLDHDSWTKLEQPFRFTDTLLEVVAKGGGARSRTLTLDERRLLDRANFWMTVAQDELDGLAIAPTLTQKFAGAFARKRLKRMRQRFERSRLPPLISIYAPDGTLITSPEEWRSHAPPKAGAAQWRDGRSAKELAKAWALGAMPRDLFALLGSHQATKDFSAERALAEHRTALDRFSGEARNHDLILVGTTGEARMLIAIEAKADEPFGKPIGAYVEAKIGRAHV
jgi:hypothetical protein